MAGVMDEDSQYESIEGQGGGHVADLYNCSWVGAQIPLVNMAFYLDMGKRELSIADLDSQRVLERQTLTENIKRVRPAVWTKH